jgi:hypothetical protein
MTREWKGFAIGQLAHLIRQGDGTVQCNKGQVRWLKRALKQRPQAATRQLNQMVLLREGGMTQPEIAAAMGCHLSSLRGRGACRSTLAAPLA